MKIPSFVAAVLAVTCYTATPTAAAVRAVTTIVFDEPMTFGDPLNRTFDALEIDWATPSMTELIDESDLTDLTFRLLSGGSTMYADVAMSAGTVQPIGGVSRSLSDLFFFFNVSDDSGPLGLFDWDNDYDVRQVGAASGETYNIYGGVEFLEGPVAFAYLDGYFDGGLVDDPLTSFTQSTQFVPEPATLACGLLWLAAGWRLGIRHRRRRM